MYGRMGLEKVVEESQEAGWWVVGGMCSEKLSASRTRSTCRSYAYAQHFSRLAAEDSLTVAKFSPNASGTPQ